jgi:hypothetical protein
MRAIATAMGFPPEVWFEESIGDVMPIGPSDSNRGMSGRVESLFDAIRNPTSFGLNDVCAGRLTPKGSTCQRCCGG